MSTNKGLLLSMTMGYEKVYIVQTHMSSSNHIDGSTELDELNVQQTYKFTKSVRQEIARIRMRHRAAIDDRTLSFQSLRLCDGESRKFIEERIAIADKEYKKVSAYLGASVMFIPLDMDEVHKGELHSQVMAALWYRVYKDAFDRMRDVIEKNGNNVLPVRSKNALLRMCDHLRGVNVMMDKNVEKLIDDIQKSIEADALEPMVEYLDGELSRLTGKNQASSSGRWAKIEL